MALKLKCMSLNVDGLNNVIKRHRIAKVIKLEKKNRKKE